MKKQHCDSASFTSARIDPKGMGGGTCHKI